VSVARQPRLTFFVDVDNTLLDNDAAKREMDRRMAVLIGKHGSERFWEIYEEVRAETAMVDIPRTLARFSTELSDQETRFLLADLFMRFPFAQFLFPGTPATVAHIRTLGSVAILSDGDAIFQTAKIIRSGLAAAVDGYAHVYAHKEEHLDELTGAFPADHYVLIDDKPEVITKVAARLTAPLTTVFVRQGKYAAKAPSGNWTGAGLTVESIGDVRAIDIGAYVAVGRGTIDRT
jgi:FMN phosphatase YigB (HAD superfamily)